MTASPGRGAWPASPVPPVAGRSVPASGAATATERPGGTTTSPPYTRTRGTDFRSTSIDAQIFDEGTRTLTVFGSGTNAGHAVTFTMVAVDNGTSAGTFSLTLSDGYSVAGTLISGAIHLF